MPVERRYPIILMSILILAAPGCRRFAVKLGLTYVAFTKVEGEQSIAEGVTALDVDIRAGELRVIGDSPDSIRVEADVKIKESSANPDLDRGTFEDHIRIESVDGTLRVSDAHTGQPDEKDWRVSLIVHVPPHLAVNLRTGAGRIAVENMTSDIRATSGAGEIEIRSTDVGVLMVDTGAGKIDIAVEGTTGPVTVTAGAGSVAVRIAERPPTKDVVITVAVGDVELELPPNTAGRFSLKSNVGRVSVSGHEGIEVKRVAVGASGTGTIGDGGPNYRVEAAVGSISLK